MTDEEGNERGLWKTTWTLKSGRDVPDMQSYREDKTQYTGLNGKYVTIVDDQLAAIASTPSRWPRLRKWLR